MKRTVLMFAALLASTAGVLAVQAQAQTQRVALGERFELSAGGTARIDAETLQVGFEKVSADSRCPKGEQCIRAGDATVRLWLQKASGAKESLDIRTSNSDEGAAATALGYEVRLLGLAPYPVSGRAIAEKDYVVTLVVTRGSPPSSAIQ